MSALGGKADLIRGEADIAAGSPASAGLPFCPSRGTMCRCAARTITLCLLATLALADVAGVASVKRAALAAYAEHFMEVVAWPPGGSAPSRRVSAP